MSPNVHKRNLSIFHTMLLNKRKRRNEQARMREDCTFAVK